METPWGRSQEVDEIAPGITWVSTAGHGGIKLSDARRMEMPQHIRELQTFAGGNWYEEDCDAALVVIAFPQYFSANALEQAQKIAGSRLTKD